MEADSINYLPTDELSKFMLLHTITSLNFLIIIGKKELLAMECITTEIVLEIYYVRELFQDKK